MTANPKCGVKSRIENIHCDGDRNRYCLKNTIRVNIL